MGKDSEQDTKSVSEIESDIARARERLVGTVDELIQRAQPGDIARRQKESSMAKFNEATHTQDGELRSERIASVLGAVSAVLLAVGLLRRSRG